MYVPPLVFFNVSHSQATSTSSAGNGSFVNGGTESLSDSLPGLHGAIQSSVAVVSRMVEGMKPDLRMYVSSMRQCLPLYVPWPITYIYVCRHLRMYIRHT